MLRLVSLALFVAIGCYSAMLAIQNRHYAYVLTTMNRINDGQAIPVTQLQQASDIAMSAVASGCRSNILRPALLVNLHNLNRFNEAEDYDSWAKAQAQMATFISAMAHCLPADGNLWLRDALVSRAVAENPDALHRKLSLSMQLMPYEGLQLNARLFLWKRLTPYTLSICEDLARQDIRTVLLYGDKKMRKAIIEGMSPEFSKLLEDERSKLPADATAT